MMWPMGLLSFFNFLKRCLFGEKEAGVLGMGNDELLIVVVLKSRSLLKFPVSRIF